MCPGVDRRGRCRISSPSSCRQSKRAVLVGRSCVAHATFYCGINVLCNRSWVSGIPLVETLASLHEIQDSRRNCSRSRLSMSLWMVAEEIFRQLLFLGNWRAFSKDHCCHVGSQWKSYCSDIAVTPIYHLVDYRDHSMESVSVQEMRNAFRQKEEQIHRLEPRR